MHRVKHLFEQICSMSNLRQAAKEALRGKRTRLPGALFFMEQEKELALLHEQLRDGTYRHGPYHYFWIHDPKVRRVAAAPFRDRVVHHAIVRVIEPVFERRFIEDSYACRVGKGTHAAMRRALHFARGHRYALKCDVQKYFPSIDHEVLMGLVQEIAEFIRATGRFGDAAWIKTDNAPIYSQEHLGELRQFTSVLTLTLRVMTS